MGDFTLMVPCVFLKKKTGWILSSLRAYYVYA